MSVATKESLQALEKEQLIDEVIKFQTGYFDLVTKYNTDVKILQDNLAAKEQELTDLKASASAKKPSEKVKALQDTIAAQEKEIVDLNKEIADLNKEIADLKEEINTKNLKLKDINQMIKPTSDTIIQTYFIKAYENRIGTVQYGGEIFNLATAIVKLVDNKLEWKITIHRNTFVEPGEHSSSRELTGVEMNVIKQISIDKGWYVAFKSFLSIPSEYEPDTFDTTLLFT